jgi:broad specificity phosphatase PhoE
MRQHPPALPAGQCSCIEDRGNVMRLIIVRHGESEWNRIGRYQGQHDAPLSDLGLRQAEALALRLCDEPLDAIFTSPPQRAAKTAEAIARFLYVTHLVRELNIPFCDL